MAIEQKYGHIAVPGVPDNEPVFILRAQDMLAPEAIYHYARRAVGDQVGWEKCCEVARMFSQWPTRKIPD